MFSGAQLSHKSWRTCTKDSFSCLTTSGARSKFTYYADRNAFPLNICNANQTSNTSNGVYITTEVYGHVSLTAETQFYWSHKPRHSRSLNNDWKPEAGIQNPDLYDPLTEEYYMMIVIIKSRNIKFHGIINVPLDVTLYS